MLGCSRVGSTNSLSLGEANNEVASETNQTNIESLRTIGDLYYDTALKVLSLKRNWQIIQWRGSSKNFVLKAEYLFFGKTKDEIPKSKITIIIKFSLFY